MGTGFEDALHRIYEILIHCYPPSAVQLVDPLRSKKALLFQTFSRLSDESPIYYIRGQRLTYASSEMRSAWDDE